MSQYIVHDADGKIISAASGENTPLPAVDNVNTFILECDFDINMVDNLIVENGAVRNKTQMEIDAENEPLILVQFRSERDGLLAASDWTQSVDSPLSEAQQQSWREYRQQLRDLPETTTDPSNPAWPTPPA